MLRLAPAPGSHRVALRAAATVLLALLVLEAMGRLDLALYAAFGTFASVYGGAAPTSQRWRAQVGAGLVLVSAVLSGSLVGLSPDRAWLVVPVAGAWAALAASLSDRFRWRPPGPLFAVFAVAASGAVPTTAIDVAASTAVAATTGAVGVLLGALEASVPVLHRAAVPGPAQQSDRAASLPTHPAPDRARRRVQAVRCAIAVIVAGLIATTSGIGHPYWAMVAAVAPMAGFTLSEQVSRGVYRALGTSIGLILATGLLLLDLPTAATVVVVTVLQGAAELLAPRNYAAALVFVTPLALLLGQLAEPQPVITLIADRFIETVIGVSVGVLAVVLTRRRSASPP